MNILGILSIAAIGAFFLFLRYLEYSICRQQRKRLAQLASLPCPRCGGSFGVEAANGACEEGQRRMAEALNDAKKRGVLLRVVMLWPVTCPHCGTNYVFQPDQAELTQKSTWRQVDV